MIWTNCFAKCKFCICSEAVKKLWYVFQVFLPPKLTVFLGEGPVPKIEGPASQFYPLSPLLIFLFYASNHLKTFMNFYLTFDYSKENSFSILMYYTEAPTSPYGTQLPPESFVTIFTNMQIISTPQVERNPNILFPLRS